MKLDTINPVKDFECDIFVNKHEYMSWGNIHVEYISSLLTSQHHTS